MTVCAPDYGVTLLAAGTRRLLCSGLPLSPSAPEKGHRDFGNPEAGEVSRFVSVSRRDRGRGVTIYPCIICLARASPSSAVIAGTTVMSKTSPHSVLMAMIGAMLSAS